MAGLNRTAKLAFGHPGLDTTAAKIGDRLTIQNDIGATDAHVLVVHVEGRTVTTTYTDVHRVRAKFFMSLFEGEPCAWSPLGGEHEQRNLAERRGILSADRRLRGARRADLDRFLAFLGSRIVFLIDWNKARKALQTFCRKLERSSCCRELRSAKTGLAPFSSSAAPNSSSTPSGELQPDASPMAFRSTRRWGRTNARRSCATFCTLRAKV